MFNNCSNQAAKRQCNVSLLKLLYHLVNCGSGVCVFSHMFTEPGEYLHFPWLLDSKSKYMTSQLYINN